MENRGNAYTYVIQTYYMSSNILNSVYCITLDYEKTRFSIYFAWVARLHSKKPL